MRRKVVFSDVDGTLVHLSTDLTDLGEFADAHTFTTNNGGSLVVHSLPPSSTGIQGYISERSLQLIAALRRRGHLFVLISGARSTTFFERLPYLPAADAYVMENGGRIFFQVEHALTAAPIVEDLLWREMHLAAGPSSQISIEPSRRSGDLWDLFRRLESAGWSCDAKSYSTDFRVSLKKSKGKTEADLKAVIESLPLSLASSFNLGSADFYPATSGKEKAAAYLMSKFGTTKEDCVSMGDDDNDLALAATMSHTYIPGFTAASVRDAVARRPEAFTVASQRGFEGTNELLEGMILEFGSVGLRSTYSSFAATSFCIAAAVMTVYLSRLRRNR